MKFDEKEERYRGGLELKKKKKRQGVYWINMGWFKLKECAKGKVSVFDKVVCWIEFPMQMRFSTELFFNY